MQSAIVSIFIKMSYFLEKCLQEYQPLILLIFSSIIVRSIAYGVRTATNIGSASYNKWRQMMNLPQHWFLLQQGMIVFSQYGSFED